jgi:hypothetical protein
MSSSTGFDTVYANCEICNTTTNPATDPYGPRDNDDVRVVRTEDGGWLLAHGYCLEEGKQEGLEQFMAGGEA